MAKELLFLVEDAVEGGYVARALGYSIFTEADSWEDLKRAIRDAVECHFEEGDLPDLIRLHAVRDEVVTAVDCHVISEEGNWRRCFAGLAMRSRARLAATCA